MAVLAITNTLFYHAETLADIEALGSDDNITADSIAWIEGLDNFYYPSVISAATTTWAVGIQGIPAGLPNEGLVLFTDAGNRGSFLGGGTVLRDLKGNATGGTLNGVTVTDSHLNFDGTNDNINFTKGAALDNLFDDGGAGATVMVWCRPTLGSTQVLVNTQGASADDGWELRVSTTGQVVFFHDWSTIDFTSSSSSSVTDGRWTSVTYVGDGNGGGIYLNGKGATASGFGGTGTQADDTGNDLYIGERENGTADFDGDIDVVLIWNRQLSNAEIKQAHDVMRQRFIQQGMILIDTLTATSGVTSLTFTGLNGNADGTYYLTGRTSFAGAFQVEARPNGLLTNMVSIARPNGAAGINSTTGWVLVSNLGADGAPEGTAVVDAWIYPEENKGGSTSTRSGRRMYRGVGTNAVNATPVAGDLASWVTGGIWDEATTNMVTLEIAASLGTMETGTSFSLYFIEDDG